MLPSATFAITETEFYGGIHHRHGDGDGLTLSPETAGVPTDAEMPFQPLKDDRDQIYMQMDDRDWL